MRLLLAVLAVAALARPARADEAIAWDAPRGCPAAEKVRARVIENLGRELREGEVVAQLAVTKRGRRWKVTMTVKLGEAEPGVRTLEAGSCAELAEAAALILALTIDPFAGEGEPSPVAEEPELIEIEEAAVAEETDAETPPIADLTRLHVDDPDPEPRPPMPVAARARVLVGGDLGSLPAPASGWGAAAEVSIGPWSVDAGVQQFTEQRAVAPPEPGEPPQDQGALIGLTSVEVRGCYSGGRRPWRAGGCVGADAAITRSVGYGFTDNEPQRSTIGGGLVFGALWAVRIAGPIGVRADITATWQIARTVLTSGGVVLHDPDILVWRGFAGVEATWP